MNTVLSLLHLPAIDLEAYEHISSKSTYGRWAQDQAKGLFKKYEEKGVHRDAIESIMANRPAVHQMELMRIQIKDGDIYASESNRHKAFYHELIHALKMTIRHYPIQDLDVIIDVGDGTPRDCALARCDVPILANTRYSWDQETILIPDPLSIRRFPELYYWIKQYRKELPWDKKRPMMYWRGDISGPYNIDLVTADTSDEEMASLGKKFPRGHLVRYSQMYPDDINASFNAGTLAQFETERNRKFIDYYGIPTRVSFPSSEFLYHHLQYKWLPCLDGHVSTYPGFLWRLASNSLVIKQDSDRIQWFDPLFKPFVDYVPIKRNLENMEDVLVWLKHHDAEEQMMVKHANAIQQAYLTPSKNMYYLATLLNHYASLQRFPVEVTLPLAYKPKTLKGNMQKILSTYQKKWSAAEPL